MENRPSLFSHTPDDKFVYLTLDFITVMNPQGNVMSVYLFGGRSNRSPSSPVAYYSDLRSYCSNRKVGTRQHGLSCVHVFDDKTVQWCRTCIDPISILCIRHCELKEPSGSLKLACMRYKCNLLVWD